jgi:SAM-dependent methyltransferase
MPTWDEIFQRSPGQLGEMPAEAAILLWDAVRRRGGKRVLDLGCGAGRNLVYLAREGFDVSGTDISDTAIALSRENLARAGLTADVRLADMAAQPYEDGTFDGVLSASVLHHNTRARMEAGLAEIGRVLRSGGVGAITINSTNDRKRGHGKEIEPDTYLVTEGLEEGLVHHLADEQDVRDLLKAFRLLELRENRLIRHVREGREEEPSTRAHWLCLFEKP